MKRLMMLAVLICLLGVSVNAQNESNANVQTTKISKSNDISFNDILFWVGEGSHQAMFIVNWCSPEKAFAWGYRFNGDSVLVSTIMADIKAADTRFDYTDGGGYITNITYKDSTYNLDLVGDYWMYNVNEGSVSGIGSQYVYTNDFIEFGDESCGTSDTNWIYTWDIPVTPVSNPNVSIQAITMHTMMADVFPNPCNDLLTIDLKDIHETINVQLNDINGKSVYQQILSVNGNETKTISVSNLSKGIYFVRFQGETMQKTCKIVIY